MEANRQTIMASVRLGWMRRLTAEEVRSRGWLAYSDFGGGPGYYEATQEGLEAVVDLPEECFVSLARPRSSLNGAAAVVLRALAARHEAPEWLFMVEPELRGDGFVGRPDAFALNCYSSQRFRRVGYEVKVSRADFSRELKRPEKTAQSAFFCNSFYFACPAGVLAAADIPDPYGLVVVTPSGRSRMFKRSQLVDRAPTWGTLAGLIRRYLSQEGGSDGAALAAE